MTELDVELSRTVAALVERRHLRWQAWATGTSAMAWALLATAVVTVLWR